MRRVVGALSLFAAFAGSAHVQARRVERMAPSDGRDMPADSRRNDLWAARIELAVDDLDGLAAKLSNAGIRFVSSGVVPLPSPASGKMLTVLDPDGHRVLLLHH